MRRKAERHPGRGERPQVNAPAHSSRPHQHSWKACAALSRGIACHHRVESPRSASRHVGHGGGNRGSTDLGRCGHGSPSCRSRCLLAPCGARTGTPGSGCLPLPLLPSVASPCHRCRSAGQAPAGFERLVPGRGRIRRVEPCASHHCGWAGTGGCQKARLGNPHHNRTRSSREQRGTTVNATGPGKAPS